MSIWNRTRAVLGLGLAALGGWHATVWQMLLGELLERWRRAELGTADWCAFGGHGYGWLRSSWPLTKLLDPCEQAFNDDVGEGGVD